MSASQVGLLQARLQDPDLKSLSGRFHSHITVIGDPDVLRQFCLGRAMKVTIIELADFSGRQQRDVMTTAYHRGDISTIGHQLVRAVEALEGRAFRSPG